MSIVMVTAVGTQPSEAAPDATVVDHGRHNRPTPAHPVCPERSVDKEDPSGDAAGLDIVWYAAGFGQCGPLRFLLQLEPDWTLEDLAKFVIRLDTDEDRNTGCHGNDYRYEGTHSTGRIHRTPTCDRAGWATVEVDPPEVWYACGIPVCVGPFLRATVPVWAIGGSHRVRWSLSLSAAGGGVDRAPDRGSRPAWMVEPPSPPRYIRAVHDDGTVELRWGRSDPGGGGPIEDYEIWVDAPRSRWQRIDDGVNAVRKATITGLTDSERYRFAVAAVTGD
ncbi:MAG: fibronectin type III domain-containing protein, partial [Acidimicrobiia bacterium]|nr:fibronectin type III domain-containing protein [Acidimicrobiia bacterium]